MAKVGRKLTYNDDVLKRTLEYIISCDDSIEEYHKTRGEKSDTYERIVKANIPTLAGLALHLGVHRDTVHDWSTKYPLFSDALETLKAKQEHMLVRGGLSGDYNPVIAKLVLSANHGMKEKSETDLTNSDGNLKTVIIQKSK